VDFLVSRATGQVFINEINTMPGFTTISMYSKMWVKSGVDYPTLVDRLVRLAVERPRRQARAQDERLRLAHASLVMHFVLDSDLLHP
jgi:hypothetical protein